jgi:hypothetical protein
MPEEMDIPTPEEWREIAERAIPKEWSAEQAERRYEEERAQREEIRTKNLRSACPLCNTDNVHLSVTEGYGWDAETGDWLWDEPFATDGYFFCVDCQKQIHPVFKPSTETSA